MKVSLLRTEAKKIPSSTPIEVVNASHLLKRWELDDEEDIVHDKSFLENAIAPLAHLINTVERERILEKTLKSCESRAAVLAEIALLKAEFNRKDAISDPNHWKAVNRMRSERWTPADDSDDGFGSLKFNIRPDLVRSAKAEILRDSKPHFIM